MELDKGLPRGVDILPPPLYRSALSPPKKGRVWVPSDLQGGVEGGGGHFCWTWDFGLFGLGPIAHDGQPNLCCQYTYKGQNPLQ